MMDTLNKRCTNCAHFYEWHTDYNSVLKTWIPTACGMRGCDCDDYTDEVKVSPCEVCNHPPCRECQLLSSYWKCHECRKWNVGSIPTSATGASSSYLIQRDDDGVLNLQKQEKVVNRDKTTLRITVSVNMNSKRERGFVRAFLTQMNCLHAATKPDRGDLSDLLNGKTLGSLYDKQDKATKDVTPPAKGNVIYLGDRRSDPTTTLYTHPVRHTVVRWAKPKITLIEEAGFPPPEETIDEVPVQAAQ